MNDLRSEQELFSTSGPAIGNSAAHSPAPDLTWESELVHMLSALESLRARLQDECGAGPMLPALETMLAVAKGVTAFLRPRFVEAAAGALAGVQAHYDVFLAAARPLHRRLDDSVLGSLLRLLRFRREEGDPNEQFMDAGRKLRGLLNAAFDLCARRFLSPAAAQSWTETYTVFLVELDGLFQSSGT